MVDAMSRVVAIFLAALCYLSALLMPMPATAMSPAAMAMADCDDTTTTVPPPAAHHTSAPCDAGCVSHAPALPALAPTAPLALAAPTLAAPAPTRRLTATGLQPEPPPPRSLSPQS